MSRANYRIWTQPHDDGRCSMIIEAVCQDSGTADELAVALSEWLASTVGGDIGIEEGTEG